MHISCGTMKTQMIKTIPSLYHWCTAVGIYTKKLMFLLFRIKLQHLFKVGVSFSEKLTYGCYSVSISKCNAPSCVTFCGEVFISCLEDGMQLPRVTSKSILSGFALEITCCFFFNFSTIPSSLVRIFIHLDSIKSFYKAFNRHRPGYFFMKHLI